MTHRSRKSLRITQFALRITPACSGSSKCAPRAADSWIHHHVQRTHQRSLLRCWKLSLNGSRYTHAPAHGKPPWQQHGDTWRYKEIPGCAHGSNQQHSLPRQADRERMQGYCEGGGVGGSPGSSRSRAARELPRTVMQTHKLSCIDPSLPRPMYSATRPPLPPRPGSPSGQVHPRTAPPTDLPQQPPSPLRAPTSSQTRAESAAIWG